MRCLRHRPHDVTLPRELPFKAYIPSNKPLVSPLRHRRTVHQGSHIEIWMRSAPRHWKTTTHVGGFVFVGNPQVPAEAHVSEP
ncbi:hypothetical protein MTO96_018698, partial [Rhipicephalus appendiculatus]